MERARRPRGVGATTDPGGSRPPALEGVEHRYVDLPGLRMHVAEAGAGEPLLLLHGFPQHWWAWRKVVPDLAAHYRVICPDLRGAGWTDAPRQGYETDQLLADVVALLDELQVGAVRLVGHDLGGILGYRLCLTHPERVRQYVAVAAPHPFPDLSPKMLLHVWKVWPMFLSAAPALGPWLLRAGGQWFPRHLMTSDTSDPGVWAEDDLDVFVSRLRDPARARAMAALYRGLAVAEARRSAAGAYRSNRLRTPTLGVYGKVLYVGHQPSGIPEIFAGYQGHVDEIAWAHIPGTGYYIPEEKPEAFLDLVLEFFGAAT